MEVDDEDLVPEEFGPQDRTSAFRNPFVSPDGSTPRWGPSQPIGIGPEAQGESHIPFVVFSDSAPAGSADPPSRTRQQQGGNAAKNSIVPVDTVLTELTDVSSFPTREPPGMDLDADGRQDAEQPILGLRRLQLDHFRALCDRLDRMEAQLARLEPAPASGGRRTSRTNAQLPQALQHQQILSHDVPDRHVDASAAVAIDSCEPALREVFPTVAAASIDTSPQGMQRSSPKVTVSMERPQVTFRSPPQSQDSSALIPIAGAVSGDGPVRATPSSSPSSRPRLSPTSLTVSPRNLEVQVPSGCSSPRRIVSRFSAFSNADSQQSDAFAECITDCSSPRRAKDHRPPRSPNDGVRVSQISTAANVLFNRHVDADRSDLPVRMCVRRNEAEARNDILRMFCYNLLSHPHFDTVMGAIIMVNSFFIGLELSLDSSEGDAISSVFVALEHVFLVVYLAELSLRFMACGRACLRSGWVRFDLLLAVLGVLGSWIIPLIMALSGAQENNLVISPMLLRTFRLARLARAVRLYVQFRTLWMLVSGLMSSLPTVLNVLVVLALTLYVFACIGIEMITKNPRSSEGGQFAALVEEHWETLPMIMLTLLQFVTLDSVGEIYKPMIREDWVLSFFFIPFILVVSIVLMNLVTAVIIEAFMDHARRDRETRAKYSEQLARQILPRLRQMSTQIDYDNSGFVSLEELQEASDELKEELGRLLHVDSFVDLFYILDEEGMGKVNIDDFCHGILRMSTSSNPVELTRLLKLMQQVRQDIDNIRREVSCVQAVTQSRRTSESI